MFSSLVLVLVGTVQAGAPTAASLPNTPQGRQVEAFLKAFNSGGEKAYLPEAPFKISRLAVEVEAR